jgi:hypothetical protein
LGEGVRGEGLKRDSKLFVFALSALSTRPLAGELYPNPVERRLG